MALIKCEECGKEISSEALTCPHCGATTAEGKRHKKFQANNKLSMVRTVISIADTLALCVSAYNLIIVIIEKKRWEYAFTPPLSEYESNVMKWMFIGLFIGIILSFAEAFISVKIKRSNSDIAIKYSGERINNNVWHCTCGMNNPLNRTSCVSCGRMREGTPRMSVSQGYWQCMNCGRNNPNYTGTCACGAKKPE